MANDQTEGDATMHTSIRRQAALAALALTMTATQFACQPTHTSSGDSPTADLVEHQQDAYYQAWLDAGRPCADATITATTNTAGRWACGS